ncbi:hornerin-like [Iris pallida]|uniref:Hornerin-like n=1 Tax=Iris pallida TaxID=29817 RepID=A0AAX6EGT6_IRIPA|nr:hornerin-like [Iris pallida]
MYTRHATSRGVGAPTRARALRSSPGGYRSEGGRGRPTKCGGLESGSGASVEVSGGCSVGEARLRQRKHEAAKEWSGSCRPRARRGESRTVVGGSGGADVGPHCGGSAPERFWARRPCWRRRRKEAPGSTTACGAGR